MVDAIDFGGGATDFGVTSGSTSGITSGGITSGIGAIGTGVSIFGAIQKYEGAQAETTATVNQLQLQQKQNAVRQQAMETASRRQSLENLRKTQQARAMGLESATSGGAQFGSGFAGGQAQATAMGASNEQGISQSLQSGEQMFGLENQITQQKIAYANAAGQMNTGAGLSSLGSAITSGLPMIKPLIGMFGI